MPRAFRSCRLAPPPLPPGCQDLHPDASSACCRLGPGARCSRTPHARHRSCLASTVFQICCLSVCCVLPRGPCIRFNPPSGSDARATSRFAGSSSWPSPSRRAPPRCEPFYRGGRELLPVLRLPLLSRSSCSSPPSRACCPAPGFLGPLPSVVPTPSPPAKTCLLPSSGSGGCARASRSQNARASRTTRSFQDCCL